MTELLKTLKGGRQGFLGKMRSWKLLGKSWTATRILG